MITLTSHMPFIIPDQNKLLQLPNSLNTTYLGDYFQSIRYTDETIGMFINELEKKNMLQDSIIVIYGDHNGIFEDDKPLVEKWKNQTISSEEWVRQYTNIPFIIYNPTITGASIDTVGGQIDVLPTLVHIMGLAEEKISDSAMGTNLLTRKEGATIIPSGDYLKKAAFITQDQVHELGEQHLEALNVSRLIIEGNFFK